MSFKPSNHRARMKRRRRAKQRAARPKDAAAIGVLAACLVELPTWRGILAEVKQS